MLPFSDCMDDNFIFNSDLTESPVLSSNYFKNAPLLQVMLDYAKQKRVSFHMPGHQGGSNLPAEIRCQLAEIDATELPVTADLNDPEGPALEAMRLASQAFQTAETLFVTGGSTTAIQAMITAFCPRGSSILMPRAIHRSVLNTAVLLGLKVIFLPASPVLSNAQAQGSIDQPFSPIRPPAAADLRLILEQHHDIQAVLVTSPDYFGTCPDLAALAEAAAEFGCPLLVDEAHGAHLSFAPELLPPASMLTGASACVQSAHKTLPALTQGAYLHRSAGAFLAGGNTWPADERLRQSLSLYQTSSPSLMIGATLDYARMVLQEKGNQAITSTLDSIERFQAELSPVYKGTDIKRQTADPNPGWRDPLRLVIDVISTGLTGFETARRLAELGFDVEMADIRRLILIPGIFQSVHDRKLPALAAALNRIAETARRETRTSELAKKITENRALDRLFYKHLQTAPQPVAFPALPFVGGKTSRLVSISEAEGETAAEALIPYPPGIPLIWPGENLDDRLALLRLLVENGFGVHGIVKQGGNSFIRVADC